MYNPKILHTTDSVEFEILDEQRGLYSITAHATYYPDRDGTLVDDVIVEFYSFQGNPVKKDDVPEDIQRMLWDEIDMHTWVIDF